MISSTMGKTFTTIDTSGPSRPVDPCAGAAQARSLGLSAVVIRALDNQCSALLAQAKGSAAVGAAQVNSNQPPPPPVPVSLPPVGYTVDQADAAARKKRQEKIVLGVAAAAAVGVVALVIIKRRKKKR